MPRADIAPTGCFHRLNPGYSCILYLSAPVGFAHRALTHTTGYLQRMVVC